MLLLTELALYFLAALFEILGCYSFWMVFKLQKGIIWLVGGLFSLTFFAYILSKVEMEFAGRAYAVYGGIYILSSLLWLYSFEKQPVSRWDLIGAAVIFIGIAFILFGNQK